MSNADRDDDHSKCCQEQDAPFPAGADLHVPSDPTACREQQKCKRHATKHHICGPCALGSMYESGLLMYMHTLYL